MLVIVIVIGQYIKKREEKNQKCGKQHEVDNNTDIINSKFIRNIDF